MRKLHEKVMRESLKDQHEEWGTRIA